MHEFAITRDLVDLVLEEAKKNKAHKVTGINVVIGPLTGVVDESVRFYFEMLAKDTIAEGAVISFNKPPLEVNCLDCKIAYTPDETDWSCPRCGKTNTELKSGNELYVDSIEVEDGNKST